MAMPQADPFATPFGMAAQAPAFGAPAMGSGGGGKPAAKKQKKEPAAAAATGASGMGANRSMGLNTMRLVIRCTLLACNA